MGLWDWLKGVGRKVGSFVSSGAKKVWDVIQDPRKIGEVARNIGKYVRPALPFLSMFGPKGKAISEAGGKALDVAEKIQ